MVSSISLLGFSFHLYGLIIGVALVVSLQLAYTQLRKLYSVSENGFYTAFSIVILAAVIGARAWHVATDYLTYTENWITALYIWNGGLSIFGALVVGAAALEAVKRFYFRSVPRLGLFDVAALVFPFGQSIGRWANFVNQELYGLPTALPWGIYIDTQHRIPGYETFSKFHPLFLYESICMALFGIFLLGVKKKHSVGTGVLTWYTIIFYALLRFFLDFLRIDTPRVFYGMGINQSMLLFFLILLGTFYLKRKYVGKKKN